jgi:alpha/beta superfamily hydrolase
MPVYLIVIIVLIAIGVLYLAISYYFSGIILYPARRPVTRSPREYGMEYRDIDFTSTDGLTIKGWLIPGDSDRIIVITHPGSFNRHGLPVRGQGFPPMAKKDIELLTTAKALHQEGYWVLMFDFRNHGESDRSPNGGITGVGLNEYQDVLGALEYIRKSDELKDKKVGFVSFCQGANSTIIAMSKSKEHFKTVRCCVAVQPVSVNVFTRSYVRDTYTPVSALLLMPFVNKLCQWRGGYPLEKISPLASATDICVPVLYVQARTDPWTELNDIEGFYNATPEPKEFLMLEEKMTRFDTYNYFGSHPEKILEFLDKYF